MTPNLRNMLMLFILLLALLVVPGAPAAAWAPAVAPHYEISWWTVDGGGGGGAHPRCAGPYCVRGSAGQPDAGVLSFKDLVLEGGFWPGIPPEYFIFLSAMRK